MFPAQTTVYSSIIPEAAQLGDSIAPEACASAQTMQHRQCPVEIASQRPPNHVSHTFLWRTTPGTSDCFLRARCSIMSPHAGHLISVRQVSKTRRQRLTLPFDTRTYTQHCQARRMGAKTTTTFLGDARTIFRTSGIPLWPVSTHEMPRCLPTTWHSTAPFHSFTAASAPLFPPSSPLWASPFPPARNNV